MLETSTIKWLGTYLPGKVLDTLDTGIPAREGSARKRAETTHVMERETFIERSVKGERMWWKPKGKSRCGEQPRELRTPFYKGVGACGLHTRDSGLATARCSAPSKPTGPS
jgi:hypothetical protein